MSSYSPSTVPVHEATCYMCNHPPTTRCGFLDSGPLRCPECPAVLCSRCHLRVSMHEEDDSSADEEALERLATKCPEGHAFVVKPHFNIDQKNEPESMPSVRLRVFFVLFVLFCHASGQFDCCHNKSPCIASELYATCNGNVLRCCLGSMPDQPRYWVPLHDASPECVAGARLGDALLLLTTRSIVVLYFPPTPLVIMECETTEYGARASQPVVVVSAVLETQFSGYGPTGSVVLNASSPFQFHSYALHPARPQLAANWTLRAPLAFENTTTRWSLVLGLQLEEETFVARATFPRPYAAPVDAAAATHWSDATWPVLDAEQCGYLRHQNATSHPLPCPNPFIVSLSPSSSSPSSLLSQEDDPIHLVMVPYIVALASGIVLFLVAIVAGHSQWWADVLARRAARRRAKPSYMRNEKAASPSRVYFEETESLRLRAYKPGFVVDEDGQDDNNNNHSEGVGDEV